MITLCINKTVDFNSSSGSVYYVALARGLLFVSTFSGVRFELYEISKNINVVQYVNEKDETM